MAGIPSPYGFVPAAAYVDFPDWARDPAWDEPFEDGICGTIPLRITAESPIFVRDATNRDRFFKTPKGFGIPGSAVRGLIRNVVEIASFAKLSRVNKHRFGVRDLQNRRVYGQHMAEIREIPGAGKSEPVPLVNAGWLTRVADADSEAPGHVTVARIEPCDFAKIDYGQILAIAAQRGIPRYDPGSRQSSVNKYAQWGTTSLDISVQTRLLRDADQGGAPVRVQFGRVEKQGAQNGRLVFTGQPNAWNPRAAPGRPGAGNPKHHDFVFLKGAGYPNVDVAQDVFRDFEFVHADTGQQHRMTDGGVVANPEWAFWRARFLAGDRVPVFFLLWPDGRLRAFGLAMMFRLAYLFDTRAAVRVAQPACDDTRFDLAETIFGTVRDDDTARRGRVSFGVFAAQDGTRELPAVTEVLGTPKASYYPGYIEQGEPGRPGGEEPKRQGDAWAWKTYMDPDARARGWKRYRPQAIRQSHRPTKGDGTPMNIDRIGVKFHPLDAGTVFKGDLRVHNLRPVELGAMLWALDFGERCAECYHLLGMARPLGYGRVRIDIGDVHLRANDDRVVDLAACRRAFAEHMERGLGGRWADSPQIAELLALARPIPAGSDEGRYPMLKTSDRRNEFVEGKNAGRVVPRISFAASPPVSPGRSPVTRPSVQAGGPQKSGPIWRAIAGGTTVKATLAGLTKKEKWTVTLVEHAAQGVVGSGVAGSECKVGDVVELIVVAGGDPKNLNLRWP